MKRGGGKLETYMGVTRARSVQILALLGIMYMIFMTFEVPFVFKSVSKDTSGVSFQNDAFVRPQQLDSEEELQEKEAPIRPLKEPLRVSSVSPRPQRQMREYKTLSGLIFDWRVLNSSEKDGFSGLHKSAITAFQLGEKLWEDLKSGKVKLEVEKAAQNRTELSCPNSVSLSGAQFVHKGKVMVLPCGLTLGSHITLVGKPRIAHVEYDPKISLLKDGDKSLMVSQFMLELIGLKTVDGEDPPRVLHYNPRLKGDWSGKPVIEQNTCYRQQWGTSVRCEGWKSRFDEETGESQFHCFLVFLNLCIGSILLQLFGKSFDLFAF